MQRSDRLKQMEKSVHKKTPDDNVILSSPLGTTVRFLSQEAEG
jgi:hypothetical protein